MSDDHIVMRCSFCFKFEFEVDNLFIGPDYVYTDYVAICSKCINRIKASKKSQRRVIFKPSNERG